MGADRRNGVDRRQLSIGVRRADSADAERIASLLREAFAEFERLYTPEAFGATAVAPSARGSGAAQLLLKAAEEFALAQHAARIYLSTTPFLTGAIRVYEAAGFVRVTDPPHELLGTPLFTMEKMISLGRSHEDPRRGS